MFVLYGAPPAPTNFNLYKRLVKEVLGRGVEPPPREEDYDAEQELQVGPPRAPAAPFAEALPFWRVAGRARRR